MEKLYKAFGIIKNLRFNSKQYEKIEITWFVVDRPEIDLPYEKLVANFQHLPEEAKLRTKGFIKELITHSELIELKKIFENRKSFSLSYEEVLFPVSEIVQKMKDMPATEESGFYHLYKEKNYTLPFKIDGYFRVNPADEKMAPDMQKTVVSKNLSNEIRKYMESHKFTEGEKE